MRTREARLAQRAERGHARIALLFCRMKVNRVAFRPRPVLGQLLLEHTRFLQHQHVGTEGVRSTVDALARMAARRPLTFHDTRRIPSRRMRRALGIVTRQGRSNACACGIDQRIGQPQVRLDEHHRPRRPRFARSWPDPGRPVDGLRPRRLPAGEVPVQPSFEASHAALIVFAIERHGDGAEVREGRFWMRQAEGDHSFIDVDEALVFTEGHRIQQGFDGADPVSRTRFCSNRRALVAVQQPPQQGRLPRPARPPSARIRPRRR